MAESDVDENESEPDQSIWEPEMQHDVDSDNVDISKPAVSTLPYMIKILKEKIFMLKLYIILYNIFCYT